MSLWDKLRGRVSRPSGASKAAVVAEASVPARQGGTLLRPGPAAQAVSPTAPASLAPDGANKIGGLFPVKQVLGAGSMGTVYLVQHPSWNSEVALKVPKAELITDAENRHRITVEAQAWTELGLHPHIAYCYYAQSLNDVLLLVVEYLDGGNLAQWIGRHGQSAELKTKLDLAIQFCHALEHAHARGMIHRDIKPSNVLLTKEGQLKLTDFGIARVGASESSARAPIAGAPVDGTIAGVGTEEYMPPEQWDSAQVDARADLFAFGVCLYELFCGRRPYAGRLIGAPQQALDPMVLNATLPQALGELMEQCVQWEKEKRPESAQAIRQRLSVLYEAQFKEPSAYAELPPYTVTAAALNNRALSYIELGQAELAEQAWQAALQADAKHLETIYNYGLHEWRNARLTDDALIKRLQDAAADQPTAWLPAYLQAQVYLESGDGENAKRCLAAIPEDQAGNAEIAESKRAAETLAASSDLVRTFSGHTKCVSSACISVDGRHALSGSWDNTLKLWDLASGQCLRTFTGHDGWVTSVWLNAKGCHALSGSRDKTLKLWDLASGQCLRTFNGHKHDVMSVCLTNDERHAVSGSWDHTLKLWDLATGECLRTFGDEIDSMHLGPVYSVALSQKGNYALSASMDETLKLWDLARGKCLRTFKGHTDEVTSVYLSADGHRALSGSYDKTVRLWDLANGLCLRTFTGHIGQLECVSLSDDGHYAFSGSTDKTLKLWDVASGRCLHTFAEHTESVTTIFVSADGRHVFSGSYDNTLKRWPIPKPGSPAIYRLARLGSSGDTIRSGVEYRQQVDRADQAMVLGDARVARQLLHSARTGPYTRDPRALGIWLRLYSQLRRVRLKDYWSRTLSASRADSVCLSVDGRYALCGSWDKTLEIWNVTSGQRIRSFAVDGALVTSVALSADGRRALSSFHEVVANTIKLWDQGSGECLCRLTGHTQWISSVCLSPDARYALSGSDDKTIKLWHLDSGQCLRTFTGDTHDVRSIAFSADGRHAISGGRDTTIKLWDVATGECLRTLTGHTNHVLSVCLSGDGSYAVSGGEDRTIKLWDVANGKCLRTLTGHTDTVLSVCLTADSRYALSGGYDQTLKLWDLASGECLQTLTGHIGEIRSVCLSADGRHAVSAGEDGLRLWTFDWELEDSEPADWDEGARPYLAVFLRAQQAYVATLPTERAPTEEEITRALTRGGTPVWNEEDFQRLLYTLGCAGYGWLRPAGVLNELNRMAASYDQAGTPTVARTMTGA